MLRKVSTIMAKENKTVLQKLYDNTLLRSKVNALLDEGKTLQYIVDYCQTMKFEISLGSLNNYKNKRTQAIKEGKDLGELIDRRRHTGNVIEISGKELGSSSAKEGNTPKTVDDEIAKQAQNSEVPTSILEVLEVMISKGFTTLKNTQAVDAKLLLKAMDTYAKITGNTTGGLTLRGLQEIRMQQKAREDAYAAVITEYIPKEKQAEVAQKLVDKEDEFYRNLDLTEEGARTKKALKLAGIDRI